MTARSTGKRDWPLKAKVGNEEKPQWHPSFPGRRVKVCFPFSPMGLSAAQSIFTTWSLHCGRRNTITGCWRPFPKIKGSKGGRLRWRSTFISFPNFLSSPSVLVDLCFLIKFPLRWRYAFIQIWLHGNQIFLTKCNADRYLCIIASTLSPSMQFRLIIFLYFLVHLRKQNFIVIFLLTKSLSLSQKKACTNTTFFPTCSSPNCIRITSGQS